MSKTQKRVVVGGLRHVAVVLAAGTNGLGAVRSLQLRGIASIVACRSPYEAAYLSRYPVRKVLIPSEPDLGDWLERFLGDVAKDADCVITTSDEFASVVQRLTHLGRLAIPCALPPKNLVNVLNDKRTEIDLIQGLAVPLPRTVLDLHESSGAFADMAFPLIVKPRTYSGFSVLGAKNRILNTKSDLAVFQAEFQGLLDGFIIQEVIPGDESCQWVCNATFDQNAEMVSAFTFQRLGTVPYLYGVTTFAVSRHNPEVKELCKRIGHALDYIGPAMLEFKVDPRSGECCYIEINPRLGMCNWFDTLCGVNNVYNAYALAAGQLLDCNLDNQSEGQTYLNFVMDVYARRQAGWGWRAILGYYRKHQPRNVVHPAWYWQDPLPVFGHYLNAIHKRLGRVG